MYSAFEQALSMKRALYKLDIKIINDCPITLASFISLLNVVMLNKLDCVFQSSCFC